MTCPRTKACLIAIALIATSATPSLAQSDPDRSNTLKGPSVSTETQNTLGTTDMNGHFTPVEGRPELAAFSLVTKDQSNLAAARDLDNKRTQDLTIFLVDEIDAVRDITDSITAGEEVKAQLLLAQLRQRFNPELPRDPLAPELEKMLDENQLAEFHRILDDYWHRWIQAEHPEQKIKQGSKLAAKYEHTLNHELFQQDIRLAYENSLQRYRQTLDAIYTAVQPTDDQHAQIRALVIEHVKDTRLKATSPQRQDLMLEIYHLLDEDRQEKLFLFMTSIAIDRTG